MKIRQAIIIGYLMASIIVVLGMGPFGVHGEISGPHRPGPGMHDPRPEGPPPLIISRLLDCLHRLELSEENHKAITALLEAHRRSQQDKIAAIKEKIESGNYKIDYAGVADKLVDAFMDEIF